MKKKEYIELKQVENFINSQSREIRAEYNLIVNELEVKGMLRMPLGEKVIGSNKLFAIRVIDAGNVRVFYTYAPNDVIYGLYGYVKKSRKIPKPELKKAEKIMKLLKKEGLL